MTTSQGRKRSYVALTEDYSSTTIPEHSIVVGSCVAAKAVTRSGLLSGIKTTEGLASLPGKITPQDVSLWETACLVDIEFHPDELVAVLKVADTLGDKDDAAWVESLAGMAADTDWDDAARADTMLAALLRLPPHILHRVLAAHLTGQSVTKALSTLPPPLHAAVIAAAAHDGTLEIGIYHAQAVLMHLPAVRVPAPGLHALELGPAGEEDCAASEADVDEDSDMPAHHYPSSTGALLARAASAHPSLTSLNLTGPRFRPQWLRNFAACLPPAALPHLVDLRINVDAHPSGCAELGGALALLPTLTTLSITIVINRRAELSLHSYARLAAAPASLPALQTLKIIERVPETWDPQACFDYGPHASVARTLLPLISAPALTSLHFLPSIATVPVREIFAQVTQARFPALRRLAFNGALRTDKHPGAGDAGGTPRAARSALPPPLQEVAVGSACPQSALRIATDAAHMSAAALTSFTVVSAEDGSELSEEVDMREAVWRAWSTFMRALGSCTRLRKLNLSCLFAVPFERRGVLSERLAEALLELPELTHFALRGGYDDVLGDDSSWIDGPALGRGVAGLKALECLCVDHGEGNLCLHHGEAVLDACVGLERLSHLALLCDVCEVRHISDAIPKLHALKDLRLPQALFPDGRDSDECHAFVDRFASLNLEIL